MNAEEQRFDFAVHALVSGTRRRHLVSALAGGLLGLGALPSVARKKKKKNRNKKKGQQPAPDGCAAGTRLCQGTCIPNSQCCGDADCDRCAQEICQAGSCACPAGMTRDTKGICGVRPTCIPAGRIAPSAGQCCSGSGTPGGTPGTIKCDTGQGPCYGDSGCVGNGPCLGYMCPAQYLEAVGATCPQIQTCANKGDCDSRLCQGGVCIQCGEDSPCGGGELCVEGWCYGVELAPTCGQCPPSTEICALAVDGVNWGCLRRSGV